MGFHLLPELPLVSKEPQRTMEPRALLERLRALMMKTVVEWRRALMKTLMKRRRALTEEPMGLKEEQLWLPGVALQTCLELGCPNALARRPAHSRSM